MKLLFSLIVCISLQSNLPLFGQSVTSSVIRINSTTQSWSPTQPWDKKPSIKCQALGALLSGNRILTTAEMAADATYIEMENADNTRTIPAKVIAIDYETNLALLSPASEDSSDFFKGLKPLELAPPANIGDTVDVWQLEDNGMPLVTHAIIRGVDVVSTFAPGHYFLTYLAKGSMQSASSSFTLPVVQHGKLLGLLSSYNSKDQIIDIIAPEIISAFIKDTEDGKFEGVPSLGIEVSSTVDPNFRKWLKLPDNVGGLYITRVKSKSSAELAGLKKGDVLIRIDGQDIGRRGYYSHTRYGRIFWSHLVRGSHKLGDKLPITVLRDGKEMKLIATLARPSKELIPSITYDTAPNYLVKGGFIFQELTRTYLRAFGTGWQNVAPLRFLDALANPKDYQQGRNRLVILTGTIPTPATTGYEQLNNLIVSKVNGRRIADIKSLVEAFQSPGEDGLHTIEFEKGFLQTIYLDAQITKAVDAQLLRRGIPTLYRVGKE